MSDWAERFLRSQKWPVTPQNVSFLDNWQRYEGGHTNNSATFNWLNTTTGSSYPAINSVGVRAFPNERVGFQMLARTMRNGRYPNIVRGLRAGDPGKFDLTGDLSTWVSGSPTGNTAYSAKVTGKSGVPSVTAPTAITSVPTAITSPDMGPSLDTRAFALQSMQEIASGSYSPERSLATLASMAPKRAPVKQVTRQLSRTTVGDGGIVAEAMKWLGTRYSFGGGGIKGPGPGRTGVGFDCSSFIQFLWNKRGVRIPRVTYDQWRAGRPVEFNELTPGDAVFFRMEERGPGHVGMFVGNGKFIHAPKTGDVVKISSLTEDYYRRNFVGARTYS